MDKRSRRAVLGSGFSALVVPLFGGAVQAQQVKDPLGAVAPEYRPYLPALRNRISQPPITMENLAQLRKPPPGVIPAPLPAPAFSERTIPGLDGQPPVRIYIVNAAEPGASKPAIIHMHGGGFILGSAKDGLRELQEIASAVDCIIVTVDYRLAPETPFPGSLEDNYAGLKWLHDNADALGADPKRIAVMGESAGGGHAAMLAIAARDRGEVSPVFQCLTFPMLDDRTGVTQAPPYDGAFLWTPAGNRFGWRALLGQEPGLLKPPYGSVPARVDNLNGLPATFIAVGSIDLFVDEDIEYARRLVDMGIQTELHVYPGAFHAFYRYPTPLAAIFKADRLAALKSAFAKGADV